MITLYAALIAANLSPFYLSQSGHERVRYAQSLVSTDSDSVLGRANRSYLWGAGASRMDGTPNVQSPFDQAHPPVPYWKIWDNSMRQTAQQWVAILSVLQDEGIIIDEFVADFPK